MTVSETSGQINGRILLLALINVLFDILLGPLDNLIFFNGCTANCIGSLIYKMNKTITGHSTIAEKTNMNVKENPRIKLTCRTKVKRKSQVLAV